MVIRAVGLSKAFSGVPALRDASIAVSAGEVVAVMGENGAGKSTLMRILSGALAPDGGEIAERPRSVGMVHQEAMLAPHLTVAENLYLGREPQLAGLFLDNRATIQLAREYLQKHGLNLDPTAKTGSLNAAGKQMLEVGRALRADPELLILDEPTSSLSEKETGEVLRIVEECRCRGKAILYISHRFEEVRKVASRVMVLRDGATVFTGDLARLSDADLVRHMAGDVPVIVRHAVADPLATVMGNVDASPADVAKLHAVHVARDAARAVVAQKRRDILLRWRGDGVDLTLHAGEIVGLAGLMGAGRTELCQALFCVRPRGTGEFELFGKAVAIESPRQALDAGLVYLSEDRQHFGILQGRGLSENITIAALPTTSAGMLSLSREHQIVDGMIARLKIRGRLSQAIQTLSGGNQQKVLLARWMLTKARVFMLDEPTRGIDVNAKEEVFALMAELASQGAAVLMVSSEIPELLRVCDRLLVMRQNKIVHELDPTTSTREEVLHWAL